MCILYQAYLIFFRLYPDIKNKENYDLKSGAARSRRTQGWAMLVLAGPGSGKTLVITERTKYLINKHKISEGNILVITFTRAASKEMKDRFLKP